MAEDNDSKTEQPSQARLDRAKDEGQFAQSRELNHWFQIGGGTLVLFAFAPHIAKTLTANLQMFIAEPQSVPTDAGALQSLFAHAAENAGMILTVPLALLLVAAVAGPLVQTGIHFSTQPLHFNFSKLSPAQGIQKIVSIRAVVEFLKSLVKLALVATVCWNILHPIVPTIEHMMLMTPVEMLGELRQMVLHLCLSIFLTLTLLMIVDLIYQRFAFIAKMRMTKQEVKDEAKQSDGDPQIKQRIRQLRAQRARRRMMANVPKADVVITNPTHYAVALAYNPAEMAAPICLAKGQDLIALKIRELAGEHKITIIENPPLARALYATVEVDQNVPPEHYKAVAEVISYVFRLRNRAISR